MPEIIMAFAPLAFLIIYALKTRRMAESMVLAALLAVGAFPKIGPLKRAYQRVQAGGPAFERDEKAEKLVDIADVDESRVSPAWNAMVPLAVLVGATVFAVGGCCAAQACFNRVQAGAGIREGAHSRSSRVLNSTARRFSGILPLIYNEGGVIPIWILTAVTIRVTS